MSISKEILVAHFDYTKWASMLVVDTCKDVLEEELEQDMKSSHGGILETLRHIFFADRLWLGRFQGKPRPFRDEGEKPSLRELNEVWPGLLDEFKTYAGSLTEADVAESFSYRMLNGQEVTSTRWQALLHVVNHGSIHRGQVVGMLRQLGYQPPQTDLLTYYRIVMAPSK